MKKIVLLVLLTAVAGSFLFAQTTTTATTTINGTLGFYAGSIVVKSGSNIYFARELGRLVGFVDGFKDGAQVSMEGYVSAPAIEGQTERVFYPLKLTFNGKVYEFRQPGNINMKNTAGRGGRGLPRR